MYLSFANWSGGYWWMDGMMKTLHILWMLLGWKNFFPSTVFLFGKIFRWNAQRAIGINVTVLQHLVYSATVNCALKLNTDSFL